MGTNYYWKPTDEALGGAEGTLRAQHLKPLHIGKDSAGWEFCFQAIDIKPGRHEVEFAGIEAIVEVGFTLSIRSWAEWKSVIQRGGTLLNEYDETVTFEAFMQLVERTAAPGTKRRDGKPLQGFVDYLHSTDKEVNPERDWVDELGYSFTSAQFS